MTEHYCDDEGCMPARVTEEERAPGRWAAEVVILRRERDDAQRAFEQAHDAANTFGAEVDRLRDELRQQRDRAHLAGNTSHRLVGVMMPVVEAAIGYARCQETQHGDCKAEFNCHPAGDCLRQEELLRVIDAYRKVTI